MKLYAELSKTEQQDDGTIKVWGYASSGAVDSDGEIVTPDAMKAALPDYMKWGAVREMHQAKAAGTALEASVEADGRTFFGAHIVDSEAVKKVQLGVYKGFSIGGKITERDTLDKTIIKGLRLTEISLVDRPANPEAMITICKADIAEDKPEVAAIEAMIEKKEDVSDVDQIAKMLDDAVIAPADLLALSKAHIAFAERMKEVDDVNKGMGGVATLAYFIKQLQYLVSDQFNEAAREGDASAVPEDLRQQLIGLTTILQNMVAEESAEVVANVTPDDDTPEVIQMAEPVADLVKAGAKFSGKTKEALSKVHEAAKACCDHLDALGYKDDDGEKADEPEVTKAEEVAAPVAAEPAFDMEAITKAVTVEFAERLQKVTDINEQLVKRLAALEAQPAPGRALLRAISKADDNHEPIRKSAVEELLQKTANPTPEQIAEAQVRDMYRAPR